MINLLFISIIIVFCIDLSGAMDKLNIFVWNKLYKGVKYNGWTIPLIGCSLCCTWWAGIIYSIFTGIFSWGILTYIALLALLTPITKDILILIKDLLNKIIDIIYKFTN